MLFYGGGVFWDIIDVSRVTHGNIVLTLLYLGLLLAFVMTKIVQLMLYGRKRFATSVGM